MIKVQKELVSLKLQYPSTTIETNGNNAKDDSNYKVDSSNKNSNDRVIDNVNGNGNNNVSKEKTKINDNTTTKYYSKVTVPNTKTSVPSSKTSTPSTIPSETKPTNTVVTTPGKDEGGNPIVDTSSYEVEKNGVKYIAKPHAKTFTDLVEATNWANNNLNGYNFFIVEPLKDNPKYYYVIFFKKK